MPNTQPSQTYEQEFEAAYAQFANPYRGGVLSAERRHDPKISRKRLIADSESLLAQLGWAVRDLVSARRWGYEESGEAQRLRNRVVKLFSLLTGEQKDEMRRWDDARRAVNNGRL